MDRYSAWFIARGENILVPQSKKTVLAGYIAALAIFILLAVIFPPLPD